MRHLLLTFVCCVASLPAFCDSRIIDSLKNALAHANHDSVRIDLLIALSQRLPLSDSTLKIAYATEALQLAENTNDAGRTMNCLENSGTMYCYSFGNNKKAVGFLERFYRDACINKDSVLQNRALNNLMVVYTNLSDFATAIEYGNKALSLSTRKDWQVSSLGNLGSTYLKVGDYTKAMDCFAKSLKVEEAVIAEKQNPTFSDTSCSAGLLLIIGDVYIKLGELDRAIDNYDKAIKFYNNRIISGTANALNGKASVYEMRGRYPEAAALYKKAISLVGSNMKYAEHSRTAYVALANLYIKTGDITTARSYADSALRIIHESGDEEKQPDVYLTLGKIGINQKKYGEAVTQLQHAVKIASSIHALEAEDEGWRLLSTTYDAMKRPADALEAYHNYITIRDSMYNVDKARALTRMVIESDYNTRRLTDSISAMKRELMMHAQIREQKLMTRSAIAGVALLLTLVFFVYRGYRHERRSNIIITKAKDEISQEKQKSEALLLNILPEEVAQELKMSGSVQPRQFDEVSVMFTDFVGFTVAGERMTPAELVAELHTCFKQFDAIIGKYNIEKIKTVGDGYIAVAGMPFSDLNHATNIVNAAMEIRDFMIENKKQFADHAFGIRIGINSGPVVAGIVGVTKFAYDIWGDTVNVAARMEQNSDEGRINISGTTYALVKDHFNCTYRGNLDVKHKGLMDMYFVDSRK